MILFLYQILDSVPSEIALLIVGALNFKASWSHVFDEDARRRIFTKSNGRKVRIPMLKRISQQQTIVKFETEILRNMAITAVAIPYEVSKFSAHLNSFNDYIICFFFYRTNLAVLK